MTLETLEKIIRSNCSSLGMETLTNSAYYFCKFQVGTDEFWNIMETQIIKSKDTLSIEQLSKILLSFTMNKRKISDDFWKQFLASILNKIDKASPKDTFYLAMALGKGKINPGLIHSDLYYTIYLNVSRHTLKDEFDLYQLAQLSMFLCSPYASPYVPDDFWTESLEKALTQAISNFRKFEGKINKEVYLEDFVRALVSFSIRQIGSQHFVDKVESLMTIEQDSLNPKMCENLLFFFTRVGSSKNVSIIETILKKVQNEKMIETNKFRDHTMVMNILNQYKIEMPQLWAQIEKQFNDAFFKQQNKTMMPGDQITEIVGIYTFEFARAAKGTVIWDEFKRFIRSRAESRSQLNLNSIAQFAYVMVARNMTEDHQVWQYLTEQVKSQLNNRRLNPEDLDIENICMVIGSFQSSGHLTPELQSLILSKVNEVIQSLQIDEVARLFATISRYASTEQRSGLESEQFLKLKEEVAKTVDSKAQAMRFEDMLQWSLPLAAEQIKSEQVWKRFRDIVVENESRLTFADYVNLAWSFTKVEFRDPVLFKQIEDCLLKEIALQEKDPEA